MTTLVLTGDPHLDARTAGKERLVEIVEFYDRVALEARSAGADWIVDLGDNFDPGDMDSLYCAVLVEISALLAEAARFGFIRIAGNHDVHEVAWRAAPHLDPRPVTVLSPLASVLEVSQPNPPWGVFSRVYELPTYERLHAMLPLDVLALPYVAAAFCRTPDGKPVDLHGAAIAAASAARSKEGEHHPPLVVIGHYTDIPGALSGSESEEMARGRSTTFPAREIGALRPALVANGHYHRHQVVDCGPGVQVVCPGSPLRYTFGERGDAQKGYVVARI